jgi:murein L,D-transpeptidase YafK
MQTPAEIPRGFSLHYFCVANRIAKAPLKTPPRKINSNICAFEKWRSMDTVIKLTVMFSSIFLGSGISLTHPPRGKPVAPSAVSANHERKGGGSPEGTVYIIIDKSDYELQVYDDKGWYATYPVVFGNSSLEDKKMEGDRNTPEGTFRVISKKMHPKWDRFIMLDYPTKESYEKFNQRKQRGEIPGNSGIGGGVGIHGTWPHEDYQVDKYKNWTNGCIALKNEDVEEIYNYVPLGTKVIIRK